MTAATARKPANRTILVIEDYQDTRYLLSVLLRKHGYNVLEAEDGLEGFLKATGARPDLIIMDLTLPKMDGIEAARRIHANPKLSSTPIIALSAYLTPGVQHEIFNAGCTEMFPKPFDSDSLLECIEVTLRTKGCR
jgi:two-component system, cell cycle response regulator DivK